MLSSSLGLGLSGYDLGIGVAALGLGLVGFRVSLGFTVWRKVRGNDWKTNS